AAGSYRLFVRLADFGGGINRIAIECAGVSKAYEWGSRWRRLNAAALLQRLRGVHSLVTWREVGTFPLPAGTQRVAIEVQQADQTYLIVDALYFTTDADEPRPIGWSPLAQPIQSGAPVKRAHTVVTVDEINTARTNAQRFDWARDQRDVIL